jgi:hypothetical protein
MGNICNEFLKDKIFGYFEQINQEKFKKGHFYGLFKGAYDSQPFCDKYIYKGKYMFGMSDPILFDINSNRAISLLPFLFWEEDMVVGGNLKCYTLDKIDKATIPTS